MSNSVAAASSIFMVTFRFWGRVDSCSDASFGDGARARFFPIPGAMVA